MGRLAYITVASIVFAAVAGGCKKKTAQQIMEDPDEKGRLRKIAQNLEEAYANAPLPPIVESPSLADRLEKWDDFRTCTVKTYAARRREADKRAREGEPRPTRHASIGDETVEECAVQMAVANKDPSVCERLAIEYPNPSGEMSLVPVRCWDTRARVLGLPDECPVIWMPGDLPGRNPECLALARRDITICSFAPSPGRCRALISGDSASCEASDGAPDCHLALEYWKGLIPVGTLPLLYDPDKRSKIPLEVKIDLYWKDQARQRIHVDGPTSAAAISWPAGRARVAFTEAATKFWGGTVPLEAAQVAWRAGTPVIKLAFVPGGVLSGARKLQPPGATAAATFIAIWPDPNDFWRCAVGPHSTGQVRFDAGHGQPGDFVTGTVEGRNLPCSDGTELNVDIKFRLLILDVR